MYAFAYERPTTLADAINLRDRGWDQGLFVVLGVAAGASKLLGLDAAQTGDALAIAMSVSLLSSLVLALVWTSNLGARLIRRGGHHDATAGGFGPGHDPLVDVEENGQLRVAGPLARQFERYLCVQPCRAGCVTQIVPAPRLRISRALALPAFPFCPLCEA